MVSKEKKHDLNLIKKQNTWYLYEKPDTINSSKTQKTVIEKVKQFIQ